jgi:hypothetical protein
MSNNFIKSVYLFLLLSSVTVMNGCAVVGGIFKAGVWVGVIAVVVVVGLILWLVSRGSGKG